MLFKSRRQTPCRVAGQLFTAAAAAARTACQKAAKIQQQPANFGMLMLQYQIIAFGRHNIT